MIIKNLVLCVPLLLLTVSCGSEPTRQTSGTGSIAFSIDWQNAPTLSPATANKTLSPSASQAVSQAPLDCAAAGVSTVEAVVYNSSNAVVASGGPWNCLAHSGSIANAPAGTNWKVSVVGKGASGSILYYGEAGGVSVAGGQTTNLGAITASPFTLTGATATAGNSQININWTALTGASAYNIYWSTTPGVTKATGTKITNAVRPYPHAGLSNWVPYYYVITAANSSGESNASSIVTSTPTDTVPVAPTNVAAVAGNSQTTLSWDAVNGAASYNIYYSTTSGVTKATGTKISNVTSSYVHASLTNWTTYYYVVTAVDFQGESVESAQATALPPGTPPAAPTGVAAAAGSEQTTISWNAATGATSYNIYWSTTPGVTKASGTKIAGATSGYAHSSLTDWTSYYYVVTAVNSITGESAESSEATATPPGTAPAAPANVMIAAANGQNTISWDDVTGATSYNIYWSTTSSDARNTGTKITNATSPYVHPGLTNWTKYYYVVTAVNISTGESFGSSQSAVPVDGVPAVPTGVTALAGDGQATLNWSPVNGATSYNVYWSSTPGVTKAAGTKITGATSPNTVAGLVNGTTYYFVVTSVDVFGESAESIEAGAAANISTTLASLGRTNGYYHFARSIAIDSASVYWTEYNNGLEFVKKTGINGGTVTTIASGLTFLNGIAVDSTSIYFSGNNVLYKTGINDVNNVTTIASGGYPNRLAVDSTSVYWSGYSVVGKVGLAGEAFTTLASAGQSYGIAIDSTHAYWIDGTGLNATVKKVGLNAGPVTTIASGLNYPQGIAIDSTSVYWTESGMINKVGINGGTVTTLVSGLDAAYAYGIAVDATSVYWSGYGGVYKIGINGGTVISLAPDGNAYGIAVDSTSVYWPGANSIHKIPK